MSVDSNACRMPLYINRTAHVHLSLLNCWQVVPLHTILRLVRCRILWLFHPYFHVCGFKRMSHAPLHQQNCTCSFIATELLAGGSPPHHPPARSMSDPVAVPSLFPCLWIQTHVACPSTSTELHMFIYRY